MRPALAAVRCGSGYRRQPIKIDLARRAGQAVLRDLRKARQIAVRKVRQRLQGDLRIERRAIDRLCRRQCGRQIDAAVAQDGIDAAIVLCLGFVPARSSNEATSNPLSRAISGGARRGRRGTAKNDSRTGPPRSTMPLSVFGSRWVILAAA